MIVYQFRHCANGNRQIALNLKSPLTLRKQLCLIIKHIQISCLLWPISIVLITLTALERNLLKHQTWIDWRKTWHSIRELLNAPVCAPARIALATGLQAHRFGGQSNAIFLPLSRQTYYQRLHDTGYRIGCVGKLDLAKPLGNNGDGARPACFSWGFTHPLEYEGKMHAGQGNGKPFGQILKN